MIPCVLNNHFSASIRRTSMRDKSKISWKEAHEEAQRLREGSTEDVVDEDEEDSAAAAAAELKNDVHRLQQDMQDMLHKDDEEEVG